MKNFRIFLFVSILSVLFIACVFEIEGSGSYSSTVNRAELIGDWKQVNGDELSNGQASKIKSIYLTKDSVAEIKMVGPNGEKLISGEWLGSYKKEIKQLHLTVESDVMVSYRTDKNHFKALMLSVSEENGKKIMSSNNLKFEKEEN